MPLYQGISVAKVGDGQCMLFSLDNLVGCEAIGSRWLILFSHALHRDATVSSVIAAGIRQFLVPRLTYIVERQLSALLALVGDITLSEAVDTRELSRWCKRISSLIASTM
jgi:hypothetical protein